MSRATWEGAKCRTGREEPFFTKDSTTSCCVLAGFFPPPPHYLFSQSSFFLLSAGVIREASDACEAVLNVLEFICWLSFSLFTLFLSLKQETFAEWFGIMGHWVNSAPRDHFCPRKDGVISQCSTRMALINMCSLRLDS